MENKKYFSVDDIDTSKDKGIYKRDSIYYRDSFQSGVCSALHYLAKQPAADVVSREQYDTLLSEAKEIDRNAAATQKEYMQQVKELVGLLVDTAPAMNADYIKGEIERITGKSMDVANKWAIGTKELFKILDEEAAKEPYTYTDSTEDKIIFATGLSAEIRDVQKEGCKPIKKVRHRGGFETCHCPNCDSFYQIDRRFTITDEYCGNCGKLLDSAFRNYCSACGRKVGVSE